MIPILYGLNSVPRPDFVSTPRASMVSAISLPITLSRSTGNTMGLETHLPPSHIKTSPNALPAVTPMVSGFAEVPFPFFIKIPLASEVSEISLPTMLSFSNGNDARIQLFPSHIQISFGALPGVTPTV